ncbi:hypothetical protein [Terrisporobacter sp.]|uniref:hypothetical protein n=1 Tax=Terrisporobacter sp. TaxID=1965305 RepID=UPI00262573BE|nr:hypothetical protein [Terrisporobacter sp.]
MKKIYIVTTYTGTFLSFLIRKISKSPYAHISLSLNKELSPMYSFGRLNPKTPLFAGFVEENINEGLYEIKTDALCRVYSLDVKYIEYEKLRQNIEKVNNNRNRYNYDILALIYLSFNKSRESEYKYVCSHFVADMLYKSDVHIFDKSPSLVKPEDFYNNANLQLEYEGLLCNYNLENKENMLKHATC